jgi:hypothetical protein
MPWAAGNPNLPWQHFSTMLMEMLKHLMAGGQGVGGGAGGPIVNLGGPRSGS